ncbi:MAG: hypothetical protein QF371_02280 [Flavobacteriales bacterium]|nr:hypothetical protein [Flavobacteriales bacterium]
MVENLLYQCPVVVDLTDPMQLDQIINKANYLLASGIEPHELNSLEYRLISEMEDVSPMASVAVKLARSKRIVESISEPTTVSIVFAVYKEHNRIRTKEEHPHGEDFLVRKSSQLNWLFQGSNVSWNMIVVDDGCPERSGQIAQEIIEKNDLSDHVNVLFLQDAIDQKLPVVRGLSTPDDSRKGGSITYGMWHAARKCNFNNHVIVYTDADLSTHLGQLGLMLHPIINKGKNVAIGSRRESDSVVMKSSSRNDRGKLFIYLWKRLVPELDYIIDTQCGFKAFKCETVNNIIDDLIERKFAFDIELLLKSELLKEHSIDKVGIAWIDSEAASTTTDLQPYHSMLQAIAAMYRKYLPTNPESDSFATFIEELSENEFQQLLMQIPTGITDREPMDYAEYNDVLPDDLREAIGIN